MAGRRPDNIWSVAFQASTLRQKLNRGEYIWVADEFLKWVYAGGVKLAGLIRRRAAERAVFIDEHVTVTWSFNFTKSADTRNAENVLIIEDENIAEKYLKNWLYRKSINNKGY